MRIYLYGIEFVFALFTREPKREYRIKLSVTANLIVSHVQHTRKICRIMDHVSSRLVLAHRAQIPTPGKQARAGVALPLLLNIQCKWRNARTLCLVWSVECGAWSVEGAVCSVYSLQLVTRHSLCGGFNTPTLCLDSRCPPYRLRCTDRIRADVPPMNMKLYFNSLSGTFIRFYQF